MKKSMISLLLCGLILLSGCGGDESVQSLSVPSASPEAFGTSALETVPVQEAETTTLPDTSGTPETAPDASQVEPEETLEPSADYIEQAVTAAIICDAIDMLPYTPEDSMYLWRAVGYLAGQIGIDDTLVTQSGDSGVLSENSARWLAYAMDADFTGTLPEVTEEDPLISMGEDGSYLINMLSQGYLALNMTNNRASQDGDVFTEEAEFFRDEESLGTYTVTLVKYTGGAEGAQYFGYSIQDISPK